MSERLRRAYHPTTPQPGDRVVLGADESHHIARVLRLRAGDALSVFDGHGGEWEATVDEISRDGVAIRVGGPREGSVEAPLRVRLFQAASRPERLEWVLQKGTELGIASFVIVTTERCDADPPSPARLERFRKIVVEAVKQSGRRSVPEVALGPLAAPPGSVRALLLDTSPEALPIGSELAAPAPAEAWLAVGPEGGLTDSELATWRDRGWRPVALGPRILRTETAGPIAAAIVLHRWGDVGNAIAGGAATNEPRQ